MPSVRIHKRLVALEARDERRSGRNVSGEALLLLSDEDLDALYEATDDAIEREEGDFWELYALSQERSRRALGVYFAAMEALRRGGEPPEEPRGTAALDLGDRANEGDEERDGYKIWNHCRKEQRWRTRIWTQGTH